MAGSPRVLGLEVGETDTVPTPSQGPDWADRGGSLWQLENSWPWWGGVRKAKGAGKPQAPLSPPFTPGSVH